MSNTHSYRQVSETLESSLSNFDQVDLLFSGTSQSRSEEDQQANLKLKERWHSVLQNGTELATYTKNHYRAQSPLVLSALEELAKYADVSRPFRLSVIGQKGVGKSALVNALLGASGTQYTPSEVAGKAVSGTRIRLMAAPAPAPNSWPTVADSDQNTNEGKSSEINGEAGAPWEVIFLTPQRLWEVGTYLLTVARLKVPPMPGDLNSREQVTRVLQTVLDPARARGTGEEEGEEGRPRQGQSQTPGSTMQILAANARDTLAKMLEIYQNSSEVIPAGYSLSIQEEDVDGPVSPFIRQTESNIYLIVDYVRRYLSPDQAGFLAGRPIELEDVLGLDDPRDSFFALEAFKEAFAVIMVFKCDRGLNTESSSLLENLFSRDENKLAEFGSYADLNKAIIVANQFDAVTSNIAVNSGSGGNPLKGIEDIRRDLSRYTRQPVPVYLTSASIAQNARLALDSEGAKPSASYESYLNSLANLLQVVDDRRLTPDYLDFVLARRAEIEAAAADPGGMSRQVRASLILEMSGLPRLEAKVQEALEASSILRGRVANSEYYYSGAIGETALCYARHMTAYKLDLAEFTSPPASLESRQLSKFQHEIRQRLEELDRNFKQNYFAISRRYIHGPLLPEVEQARASFIETIRQAVLSNSQLIQTEQQISTGETVTDAWRKVFEDLNDWLSLEAGNQMRSLVGPLLGEVERLAADLQKQLAQQTFTPLDNAFWSNFQIRRTGMQQRLQSHAQALAVSYYTDRRFSVHDFEISEALQVGEGIRRREALIILMQQRVQEWFNKMWHLLAKVAMTEISAFVNEVRHYTLGLPADGSLLVGLELRGGTGYGQLVPQESLTAILNGLYHTSESFRRQYATREPAPAERLAQEIREWLELVHPPMDGLIELGKAVSIFGVTGPGTGRNFSHSNSSDPSSGSGSGVGSEDENDEGEEKQGEQERREREGLDGVAKVPARPKSPAAPSANPGQPLSKTEVGVNHLRVPIETRHPYSRVTRQDWEVTNSDREAGFTRLHFGRIDLGTGDTDRLILQALNSGEQTILTGKHEDYWTKPFKGRVVKVRFVSDNSLKPGWGFILDAVETVSTASLEGLEAGASR